MTVSNNNNNNNSSNTASYGQTASTIWGPKCIVTTYPQQQHSVPSVLEVSVHTLPRPLQREFQHVFDERNLDLDALQQQHQQRQQQQQQSQGNGTDEPLELWAIPTNQPAQQDLVATGDVIEQEKDRLLNVFMTFARHVCQTLRQGPGNQHPQQQQFQYWADFIDPCSGLPMLTMNCNKVYSEVDGMECCLGYKAYNAGFCKILTHPVWGSAVYPATLFAFCPRSVLIQLLESYPTTTNAASNAANK